jgi:hypothetical protein
MFCSEIIDDFFEIQKTHIHKLCGQNAEFLNVTHYPVYVKHAPGFERLIMQSWRHNLNISTITFT